MEEGKKSTKLTFNSKTEAALLKSVTLYFKSGGGVNLLSDLIDERCGESGKFFE